MGTQAIQGAVVDMVQGWLANHPILGWGLLHPLWALGGIVLLFFLSGGLLRAIAQLTEQLWIRLLQLPLEISQWLFTQLLQILRFQPRPPSLGNLGSELIDPVALQSTSNSEPHEHPDPEQQLYDIMVRLEHLEQEQTLLLKDIKTLLLRKPSWAIPTQRGLKKRALLP